ncbi:MAG: acyltransferase [Acidobacteriia bacterium]|nr:acyltransferase [Terriglobia bacterium]
METGWPAGPQKNVDSMPEGSCVWRNPHLRGRIPELDGIRGLAILLVLVWHYVCGSKTHYGIQGRLSDVLVPLNLSWSGVDLFFVLSGFLIGGILLDAKHVDSYYGTFYLRRLHRIFPLYFIWLGLFLVGLYLWNQDAALFNHDLPVWPYFLFLQNVFVVSNFTFGAGWMLVTWSLAVEEQFYILLPFAIRKLSSKGIVRLAVGAILFAPVVRFVFVMLGKNYGPYTLLPCRADALGVGVLLALGCRNQEIWAWFVSHRKEIYITFVALGLGLVVFIVHPRDRLLNTVGYSWLAMFYTSLLLLVLVNPGRMERLVFRNLVLVRLGTIAYAVYIFHQGINGLLQYALQGTIPTGWTWCISVLSLATVLILAEVSWRVLESPLIRRAHSKYQYVTEASEPPVTVLA